MSRRARAGPKDSSISPQAIDGKRVMPGRPYGHAWVIWHCPTKRTVSAGALRGCMRPEGSETSILHRQRLGWQGNTLTKALLESQFERAQYELDAVLTYSYSHGQQRWQSSHSKASYTCDGVFRSPSPASVGARQHSSNLPGGLLSPQNTTLIDSQIHLACQLALIS